MGGFLSPRRSAAGQTPSSSELAAFLHHLRTQTQALRGGKSREASQDPRSELRSPRWFGWQPSSGCRRKEQLLSRSTACSSKELQALEGKKGRLDRSPTWPHTCLVWGPCCPAFPSGEEDRFCYPTHSSVVSQTNPVLLREGRRQEKTCSPKTKSYTFTPLPLLPPPSAPTPTLLSP